jgi:hypothetical protein
MIYKDFIIKENKMKNTAKFMKRIYKLSLWLNKRYNYNSIDVQFDYGYKNNQKYEGLITIRLIFK